MLPVSLSLNIERNMFRRWGEGVRFWGDGIWSGGMVPWRSMVLGMVLGGWYGPRGYGTGEGYGSGSIVGRQYSAPPCGRTNTCENITFSATSFAFGNDKKCLSCGVLTIDAQIPEKSSGTRGHVCMFRHQTLSVILKAVVTVCNNSCGKVMFSQVCQEFCPRGGGVHPPRQTPPRQTPSPMHTPMGRHPPG